MSEPFVDAVGLAASIRRGERNPREVAEVAIRRIEERNPAVNAVVHTRFDEALDEVERGLPDGPLRGVPMLIKDLGVHVAGTPATSGSRLLAEHRPAEDSEVVARYRRAGMVLLGTTNTPEFGENASTEPALFGPTRNPWSRTHSSGGSSGGSAAAVAAGMVPVAHGNDGAGSIRVPSSMCGLFGLKPTRGRVPASPFATSLSDPLPVQHALTATVRDSAALLDAVAGSIPGAAYAAPAQPRPYAEQVARPAQRLRIAYSTVAADGTVADPQCAAKVESVARACSDLGHEVRVDWPTYDGLAAITASASLLAANLASRVDARLSELGRELRDDDLEPFTQVMLEHGRSMRARELVDAMRSAETLGWQIARAFADYDLLLTPTLPVPVPELGVLDTQDPESIYQSAGTYIAFTGVFNLTGQPAMSIPSGVDNDGLPIGVQFVAPMGGEATLFRLAGQLEQAVPWSTPGSAV